MRLIKHSCPNCSADLELPEKVERICCPGCANHFLVEIFEDVVSLRRVKEEDTIGIEGIRLYDLLSAGEIEENIEMLDKKIDLLNRQLAQRRSSAFSSLSVSFLFFFFALVWLLAERDMIALFCSTIFGVMALVAGMQLRESARSRTTLTILIIEREQLIRQANSNIPRIF